MSRVRQLHDLGQSLWLDNITRSLLRGGTLQRYIDEFSITGAFADHGEVGALLPADGGDSEEVLEKLARAGVDYAGLAAQLQRDGTRSFDDSWDDLLGCLASKAESVGVIR